MNNAEKNYRAFNESSVLSELESVNFFNVFSERKNFSQDLKFLKKMIEDGFLKEEILKKFGEKNQKLSSLEEIELNIFLDTGLSDKKNILSVINDALLKRIEVDNEVLEKSVLGTVSIFRDKFSVIGQVLGYHGGFVEKNICVDFENGDSGKIVESIGNFAKKISNLTLLFGKEIIEKDAKNRDLTSKNISLEGKNEMLSSLSDEFEFEKDEAEEKLLKSQRELKRSNYENEILSSKNVNSENEKNILYFEKADIEYEKYLLEQEKIVKEEEILDLENSFVGMEEFVDYQKGENDELREKIFNQGEKIFNLEKNISLKEEFKRKILQEKQDLEKELSEFKNKKGIFGKIFSKISGKNKNLEKEIEEKIEERNNILNKNIKNINFLNTELENLKNLNSELIARNYNSEKFSEENGNNSLKLRGENNALQEENFKLDDKNFDLNEENFSLKEKNKSLEKNISLDEEKIFNLKESKKNLKRSRKKILKEKKFLEEEILGLEEKNSLFGRFNIFKNKKINSLKKDLEGKNDEIEKLNLTIKEKNDKILSFQKKVKELEKDLLEEKIKSTKISYERDDLQGDLDDENFNSNVEKEILFEEINNLENKNSSLEGEKEDLEMENEEISIELQRTGEQLGMVYKMVGQMVAEKEEKEYLLKKSGSILDKTSEDLKKTLKDSESLKDKMKKRI